MKKELFLILHDIRSAYNVGAIFRTADGAGVSKIYISGYTPIPPDENKSYKTQADKMIEKTALGAEKSIPWENCKDLKKLLEKLKEEKISIVALEKNDGATDIKKYKTKFPMALILGNEVEGVPVDILQKCDAVVSIPMRGQKESLNVSVAAGIAMYEILG
ncbi:MAG TPA: TrmH family RNA methyltransferase [Candidatus Moranbacteria bacterium]|nr:TrmH family RNA methyltransferase [Candidatus Moranbacteria bacterium]HRY27680.1 TrmH family RNA methyltransferase [Candidatus Moranbacteria bacterium]HSA07997.1 TrmH family RNA methyltransferase [Candidatus Moranbacteria bacterium]